MHPNDVILQTVTKVLAFIIVIFSFYVFLAGHHNPGGGFIGALTTACAFLLVSVSFDIETVKKMIPVDFKTIMAVGLLIAVISGVLPFFFGENFLWQTFDYFDLPLLGNTELATALVFDIGVYLVVIAVVLAVIFTIGEEQ
ncbi:Na(+)/H(+) antiporter subunit B [Alkalihalobacillus pseudalcaliphilus]|uniref:Na(+)/H(+) antiporter subunit B n=1 Tax=Alkalihalobacillus pseudalcaliphilus TaxID=79884 RepID=UPI00064E0471|nr:Na(+)/H(+) antiporter subunit B [Alkalihalobacillus pseudalcaliphilus]KMK75916.1 monovalent cation/H+ antiporter subunit B [Alkalihalobacillus pseudalcaliphilus]